VLAFDFLSGIVAQGGKEGPATPPLCKFWSVERFSENLLLFKKSLSKDAKIRSKNFNFGEIWGRN